MIVFAFALMAAQSPTIQADRNWLERDFAARRLVREEAAPLFLQVITEWKRCLIPLAKHMSTSNDAADLVAVAALVKCSEWEASIKIGLPAQIALNTPSMPFRDAMTAAEKNVDDHFATFKSEMKDQLIALIITQRSNSTKKK